MYIHVYTYAYIYVYIYIYIYIYILFWEFEMFAETTAGSRQAPYTFPALLHTVPAYL